MRKIYFILLTCCLWSQLSAVDRIITKNNRSYRGKVVNRVDDKFVIKTVEGDEIRLPVDEVSEIQRGDVILDFNTYMRYRIEKQRPLLPLAILGIATGVYAINQYGVYQDKKTEYDQKRLDANAEPLENPGKYLAYSIASALVSAGSFYFALKPVEVRVPVGQLKLGATRQGITLALCF